MSGTRINDAALRQLFEEARTASKFSNEPVSPEVLRELYNLARMGPTSLNSQPARFVFLASPAARERLAPHVLAGNVDKIRSAPVTAIVASDSNFFEFLPRLNARPDASRMFTENSDLAQSTAFRNSTLGGAWLILAARALGLDCGPMSGFNAAAVDAEFFPDGRWKSNFLCNIGYGDFSAARPRAVRLEFDEACRIL